MLPCRLSPRKTRGVATTLTPPQLLPCGRRGSTPIGYGVGGRLLTLRNVRLGFGSGANASPNGSAFVFGRGVVLGWAYSSPRSFADFHGFAFR